MLLKNIKISVIGLGYVGLPLSIEFGKKYPVIGYDKNVKRINELKSNYDSNDDIAKKDFKKAKKVFFSYNHNAIKNSNLFIITVPTPIKKNKKPDLKFINEACNIICKYIKKECIIILESTVYPGFTEGYIAPLIEKKTNLKFNKDFFCGYSPERINPNDKIHKLTEIIKITSGSNKKISRFVDTLYKSIIKAGTHKTKNIRIAEAAKVIENSQRDINIAFINELAIIFDKMSININDVLKASNTKWNFLDFKPGLVGGHCIGVDPYYLAYKSKKLGYDPKIISSGRKINDSFSKFIANKAIKHSKLIFGTQKLRVLLMGLTFKENCKDFRNSKSIELYEHLLKSKIKVDCYDPIIRGDEIKKKHKITLLKKLNNNSYNCIILSVAHNNFKKIGYKSIEKLLINRGFIFDIKNIFNYNKKNLYL